MSSDQVVVSDAAIATAKSSSKRPLDDNNGDKKAEDPESRESSTVDNNDTAENPPKRAKVDSAASEEVATKENPLSPSTTRSSTTNNNQKDQNNNGDNGADTTGGNHVNDSTDTDAIKTGINPPNESSSPSSTESSSSQRETTTTSCGVSTTLASDDADAPNAAPPLPSPALTRSRALSTDKKQGKENTLDTVGEDGGDSKVVSPASNERWRVHQMAEDYTSLVGSMLYPATQFNNYGYDPSQRQYPMEKISLLGFVKSPFRRPTIIEKWSPYEIALFEGSMFHYGKEFRKVSKQIGTKTTREVIDFYYIWKKTGHYKKWKEQYISDEELLDDLHIPVKKPKR